MDKHLTPLIALVINLAILYGFIRLIMYFIKKSKPQGSMIKPPAPPKTTSTIARAIIWIASAISSTILVVVYAPHSILHYLVVSFWWYMFGFYIYEDSRRRYLKASWGISWAIAITIFPPLFIFYCVFRPPITFTDIPKISLGKKILIYFALLILFGLIIFISAIISVHKP